jgi:hypothetical protein
MRQAEAVGDPSCGPDRPVCSRRNHAVDPLGLREPLQRRLVLDGDDCPPVGVAEARRPGIAVDGDHEEAARVGGGEQAKLAGARSEHEQTLHPAIVATVGDSTVRRA